MAEKIVVTNNILDKVLRSLFGSSKQIILLDGRTPKDVRQGDIVVVDLGTHYRFYQSKTNNFGVTTVTDAGFTQIDLAKSIDLTNAISRLNEKDTQQDTSINNSVNNISLVGNQLQISTHNGQRNNITLPQSTSSTGGGADKADKNATNLNQLSTGDKERWKQHLGIEDANEITLGRGHNTSTAQKAPINIVIGRDNEVKKGTENIVIGHNAFAGGSGAIVIGDWWETSNTYRTTASRDTISMGVAMNQVHSVYTVGIGSYVWNKGWSNYVFGGGADSTMVRIEGKHNVAIGGMNNIKSSNCNITHNSDHTNVTFSSNNMSERNIALGHYNTLETNTDMIVVGSRNNITSNVNNSVAFGNNNNVSESNSVYLGNNVSVKRSADDKTTGAGRQNPQTINGFSFVGTDTSNTLISVGTASSPTRIQYVANGLIGPSSFDVVVGNQLYAVANQAVKLDASNLNGSDLTKFRQKILDGVTLGGSNVSIASFYELFK